MLGFRQFCAKMLLRDPLADPAPRQPAESGELPGFIVSVWMIQTAITSRYIKRGREGGLQSTEEGGVLQLLTMLVLLVVVMAAVLVPAAADCTYGGRRICDGGAVGNLPPVECLLMTGVLGDCVTGAGPGPGLSGRPSPLPPSLLPPLPARPLRLARRRLLSGRARPGQSPPATPGIASHCAAGPLSLVVRDGVQGGPGGDATPSVEGGCHRRAIQAWLISHSDLI